jgi:hypothetical protein
MTLIQSWIDSLTLLKPKNAQLFIMATIKSLMETYRVMFFYLWLTGSLVILLYISFFLIIPIFFDTYVVKESATLGTYTIRESPSWIGNLFEALMRWLYQLVFFITCLATRPSIMKKDWTYFKSRIYFFIYIAIFLLLIPKAFWPTAWPTLTSPFYIFLVLFFLDSAQDFKNFFFSLWNSLKMIMFNFPLLAIMSICYNVLLALNTYFIAPFIFMNDTVGLGFALCDIFGVWLLPICVCIYANIYIKKLHDQFDLYFQSP